MRLRLVSISAAAFALGLVACAGAPNTSEDAAGSEEDLRATTSSASHACALSRESILAAATPARRHAMERGFQWLDDKVPYSQAASHGGYRTDCSGFVSMCWELDRSSTSSDIYAGADDEALGEWSALAPADAVVKRGHVMLFLAFDDSSAKSICVLEQASTKSDMQFRVHAVADLESQGYKPVRATKLLAEAAAAPADDSTKIAPPVAPAPSSAATVATASGDPGEDDDASGLRLPPTASGCSAAPFAAGSGAMPLLGLALAASLLRRRRR